MTENDRVSVQTYVPAAQRKMWRDEADEMDMSQAEYVRSMVQAGRRSFTLGHDDTAETPTSEEPRSSGVNPMDRGLKDRILEILRGGEFADWDDIRGGVTDDIDERLEDALSELQADDVVRYSGRRDGYVVVEDGG
jgi:hypothetical protein